MASHLSINLSQEELFLILTYLKAENLMGFDQGIFRALSEKELSLVLGVAERALIARGFLKPHDDGQLHLEPPVFATIGACTFPQTSILVTHSRPKNALENYYFHTSRQMIVMHTIPLTGIHQFIAVEEKSAIAKTVLSLLNVGSRDSSVGHFGIINQDTLITAKDMADKRGSEAAFNLLSTVTPNQRAAQELADTLAEPASNTVLAYIEDAGQFTDGFTVLQGKNTIWLLTPSLAQNGTDENSVDVANVSPADIQRKVKALLKL